MIVAFIVQNVLSRLVEGFFARSKQNVLDLWYVNKIVHNLTLFVVKVRIILVDLDLDIEIFLHFYERDNV